MRLFTHTLKNTLNIVTHTENRRDTDFFTIIVTAYVVSTIVVIPIHYRARSRCHGHSPDFRNNQ